MGDDVREPQADDEALKAITARTAGMDLSDVEIGDSHTETVAMARERIAAAAASRSARWYSRLPADYAEASLADFDDNIADVLGRAVNDGRVRNIVLVGPVGTGKTHAAYALGRLAVGAGQWVEAWSLHDLFLELLPSGDNPVLMERRVKDCAVLVLDDLGAGRVTDFQKDTLTSILDHRVAQRRKTIVTTNVTEDDMRPVWGDRLCDRLRQGLVVHKFAGKSRRAPAW